MPYMLLIVEPVGQRRERGFEAGQAAYAEMMTFAEALKAQGLLIEAQSLSGLSHASRVSSRHGRVSVLDGPFAEANEMVGGFFLLNCETREEALAIAAECPAARWCTVEVRKTGPCYEFDA